MTNRDKVENRLYMREYMRDRRKQERISRDADETAEVPLATTVVLVQEELDTLPGAPVLRSLTATALAMARILDDPDATPQKAAAAGQLRQVMAEIRAFKAASTSGLTLIRNARQNRN